jgi:hypothetical protein
MPAAQHPSKEERAAARKYLEHDHAARHLGGEPGRIANRHAQEIDEQHSRARDIAMTGTARELEQLPQDLRAHQRTIRREAGITPERAAGIRKEYRSGPAAEANEPGRSRPTRSPTPTRAPTRQQRRPPQRIAAAAGAVTQQATTAAAAGAGVAADSEWGELAVDIFLAGCALSVGYLFLTKPAGTSSLMTGAANVVKVLVSPTIDPLNPKGS